MSEEQLEDVGCFWFPLDLRWVHSCSDKWPLPFMGSWKYLLVARGAFKPCKKLDMSILVLFEKEW